MIIVLVRQLFPRSEKNNYDDGFHTEPSLLTKATTLYNGVNLAAHRLSVS